MQLLTHYPIAVDSPDHIQPRSTMLDNSINLDFNRRLISLFPGQKLSVLDLGCAGGGMVKSFLDMGHFAVGLEGSDYSKIHQRAEWAVIPGNLFTCDIGYTFFLKNGMNTMQFDVVTAWEFLEHIPEDRLLTVVANIQTHLKPFGLLIGSISDRGSKYQGVEHHLTRHGFAWWKNLFEQNGFIERADLEKKFNGAWIRSVVFNFVFQFVPGEK